MKKIFLALLVIPNALTHALELKGSLDTSLNSNSVNPAYDRTISQDFSLSLFTMFDNNRILLEASGSKEYTGEGEWTYNDPAISFSRPIFKHEFVNISISESSLMGISKQSRKNTTFVTSLKLTPSFSFTEKLFGLPGFKLTYAPSVRKNFHREEVAASGKSNFSWVLANKLTPFYQISEKFYFTGYISYQRSWSYQQGISRDRVDHAEALGVMFTDALSAEVGHSYGATPLSPDGKDNRVNFYDPRYSTVYLSFSYGF